MPHKSDVLKQSQCAYGQWAKQWRVHAKTHGEHFPEMKDLLDFQNIGVGRAIVAIGNGYSFEQNIETLKKYRENVDIICVDKCLIHCINNGITPDFVLVCDANVSYEKYLEPVKDKLKDITLFANVCCNPKWTIGPEWKDVRFFALKDVLKSEIEFAGLSGCPTIIPAGTNVSNAAIILLTQSDNDGRRNFFGYDKILLVGYDYCWDESYYAFDKTGDGKTHYMRGVHLFSTNAELVYTSTNLLFSARWLEKYVKAYRLQVIQTSKKTIVAGWKFGDLAEGMQYKYRPEDSQTVIKLLEFRRKLSASIDDINKRIFDIGRDHYKNLIRNS